MPHKKQFAAAIGAIALIAQPTLAASQEANCVTEEEVGSMAIFALPGLVESMRLSCSNSLSPDGFLAVQGNDFAERYAVFQHGAWPAAKAGFMKLAQKEGLAKNEHSDILMQLPDDALMPLVEALMIQEVSQKIARRDCHKVERVMEAIAPIEPEVAGGLVGVIFSLAGVKDPPVCPMESS